MPQPFVDKHEDQLEAGPEDQAVESANASYPLEEREVETTDQKRRRLFDQLDSGDTTVVPELIKLVPAANSDRTIELFANVRAYWQGKYHRMLSFYAYSPSFSA
jgi:hypothetical protein